MDASGRPNEYNTATFISYDALFSPTGPFSRFFNDPEIQTILHVRGYNLPGVNFKYETAGGRALISGGTSTYAAAPVEHTPHWESCNNGINDDFTADRAVTQVYISVYGVCICAFICV